MLFAWSGLYDIAASGGHWKIVDKFLEAACATPSRPTPPESRRLHSTIPISSGLVHRGCAFCHGAPGMPVNPIAKQMLPSPPDLSASMRPWKEHELFYRETRLQIYRQAGSHSSARTKSGPSWRF